MRCTELFSEKFLSKTYNFKNFKYLNEHRAFNQ